MDLRSVLEMADRRIALLSTLVLFLLSAKLTYQDPV